MVYIKVDIVKKNRKTARRKKKTPPATVSQVDSGFYVGKLFMNGRSQAVRLPKELRLKGDSVRLRKMPGGILIVSDEDRRNALMRAFGSIPDFPDIERLPNQERPELEHLGD